MAETLSPLVYGQVIGRFLAAIGDSTDADTYPDAVPLSGTVTFTPSASTLLVATAQPVPATVAPVAVQCTLDSEGYLTYNGSRTVYLLATDDPSVNPTGYTYTVSFALKLDTVAVPLKGFSIAVPASGTVDLTTVAPVGSSNGVLITQGPAGPAGPGLIDGGTTGQVLAKASDADQDTIWVDQTGGSGGTGTVDSVNGVTPDGAGNVVLAPADIGAATAAQGDLADTALQVAPVTSVAGKAGAVTLVKGDVGLGNVDNTSDASKPVSSAQATAINAKYTKPSTGIPKSDLASSVQTSLGKADNAEPALPSGGTTSQFLRGDKTWAVPAGGSDEHKPRIVGRWHGPLIAGGAADGTVMGSGIMWCIPVWYDGETFDAIWHRLSIADATAVLRLGVYQTDPDNSGLPGTLIYDSGPLDGSVSGNRIVTLSPTLTLDGPHWLCAVIDSATAKAYTYKGAGLDRNWVGATNPDNVPAVCITIPGYDSTTGLPATAVTTGWSPVNIGNAVAVNLRRSA